jgi:hypothetical protein
MEGFTMANTSSGRFFYLKFNQGNKGISAVTEILPLSLVISNLLTTHENNLSHLESNELPNLELANHGAREQYFSALAKSCSDLMLLEIPVNPTKIEDNRKNLGDAYHNSLKMIECMENCEKQIKATKNDIHALSQLQNMLILSTAVCCVRKQFANKASVKIIESEMPIGINAI